MKRILAAVALCAALAYAWPLWAGFQLRQALRSGDATRLEPCVDWPVLRANLRATVAANLRANETGGWWRRQATRVIVAPLAGRSIEAFVTPDRLARLIANRLQPTPPTPGADGDAADPDAADPMAPRRLRYAFFDSPARFRIEIADTTNASRRLVSILALSGFRWKLVDVYYDTRG